jgi:hypothetical protein
VLEVAVRLVLGGVLAGASLAKLASPASSRAALSTFGITARRAQAVVFPLLITAELGLAIAVIAGSETAAWLAAALMAAFAALTFLPREQLSTDQWLSLGLGLVLLVCAGLAVAVLALAREVGMLRLRLGPQGALEIAEEGPPLGAAAEVIEEFDLEPEARLALAVFVSEDCHVCRALEPAVDSVAREPVVAVRSFEEHAQAAAWERLRIPGSPFAIALDLEGTVLAKGTFNNLAQLESVLAAAERRKAERDLAAAAGV